MDITYSNLSNTIIKSHLADTVSNRLCELGTFSKQRIMHLRAIFNLAKFEASREVAKLYNTFSNTDVELIDKSRASFLVKKTPWHLRTAALHRIFIESLNHCEHTVISMAQPVPEEACESRFHWCNSTVQLKCLANIVFYKLSSTCS